jgi:predicted outer membrane protein
MRSLLTLLALATLLLLPCLAVAADKPGQADLDAATDLQITAETLGDLEKVIKLAESALQKGLDKEQEDFAKKILSSALYQHANRNAESIIERRRSCMCCPGRGAICRRPRRRRARRSSC